MQDETPAESILSIANEKSALATAAKNPSSVLAGAIAKVFASSDPDGEFLKMARIAIGNAGIEPRRQMIYTLAKAFGADRAALKRYLRRHGVCGERD